MMRFEGIERDLVLLPNLTNFKTKLSLYDPNPIIDIFHCLI